MNLAPVSPALPSTFAAADAAANGATDREKLAGVAKQFEAIFLRQMLSSARQTDFGGGLFSDSQAMGTFRQMQDERFAEIASERGAFGLGKMIEAHLARFTADPAPNGGPTAAQATLPEVTGNGI